MRELAADAIPVAVTYRVRQLYYRRLRQTCTTREVVQAHRADALFDAHRMI